MPSYPRRVDGETRAERVRDGLLEARLIARSAGETGLEEEPKRVLLGEDGRVMFCYRRAAYTVRPSGLTLTRQHGSLLEHRHYSPGGKLLDRRLALIGKPERN